MSGGVLPRPPSFRDPPPLSRVQRAANDPSTIGDGHCGCGGTRHPRRATRNTRSFLERYAIFASGETVLMLRRDAFVAAEPLDDSGWRAMMNARGEDMFGEDNYFSDTKMRNDWETVLERTVAVIARPVVDVRSGTLGGGDVSEATAPVLLTAFHGKASAATPVFLQVRFDRRLDSNRFRSVGGSTRVDGGAYKGRSPHPTTASLSHRRRRSARGSIRTVPTRPDATHISYYPQGAARRARRVSARRLLRVHDRHGRKHQRRRSRDL